MIPKFSFWVDYAFKLPKLKTVKLGVIIYALSLVSPMLQKGFIRTCNVCIKVFHFYTEYWGSSCLQDIDSCEGQQNNFHKVLNLINQCRLCG